MTNPKEAVGWLNFALNLRESITSIEQSLSKSKSDVDGIRTEIMLLVERLEHFDDLLLRLERRIDRIEDRTPNVAVVAVSPYPSTKEVPRLTSDDKSVDP
ncbi:hypothetical protein [Azovibrio restrictus]|uniref:hypothetical protein n=1 Tax=Azovibrio restrictus TaxID=146938 RepID=UPI00047A4917|nr:hypothetical protein [Azovibrio restrictus]